MTERHECGAPYNARYAAFECGYPLNDGCHAGETADDYFAGEEVAAWEALVDEAFDWNRPGHRPMTQEEALIMDDWEFEVHGEEPITPDALVAAEIAALDIPF